MAPRAGLATRLNDFGTNRHRTRLARRLSNSLHPPELVSLIDMESSRGDNHFMRLFMTTQTLSVAVFIGESPSRSAASPPPRHQQHLRSFGVPIKNPIGNIQREQGPGCVPLVEKKETRTAEQEREKPTRNKPPHEFKIENLQDDVSTFLTKYRRFLDCCKTDLNELQQIEEMGNEVGDLLKSTQTNMSNYSMASRGIMLHEMIPTVSRARADLKKLRATLERINTSTNTRKSRGFEASGREANAIREMEESIERDIHAPKLSTGPKTGASIGNAPAAGPSIGKTPKTGDTIGAEGVTGQGIGASSKNSHDIGSSGPSRVWDRRYRPCGSFNRRVHPQQRIVFGRRLIPATFHGGIQLVGLIGRIELRRL